MSTHRTFLALVAVAVAVVVPLGASAAPPAASPGSPEYLATIGDGGLGSAVGPDGALYATNPVAGEIWRIDPESGAKTLYASGLPTQLIPLGGVMDVAFIGNTAYALVTLVGSDLFSGICGSCSTVGIYRIDGPQSSTVIADIGAWAVSHPPSGFAFFVPTGVQYALETYRGGFLVTDGHHNRVYRVTLDGAVTEMIHFGDVVPTGLEVHGNTIYLAEAGPVPHLPQTGKIVAFGPGSSTAADVASGARLAVDVEMGRGQTLFALSQGHFSCTDPACAGSPADPETGALMRAGANGSFTTVVDELDQPTSLEIVGNTAYVVTLGGEILTIEDIAGPPYG